MAVPKKLSSPSSSTSITQSPSVLSIEAPETAFPNDTVAPRDVEAQKTPQQKATHWQLVYDQTHVTPAVLNHKYQGSGTEDDPFIVEYIPNDRRNPMLFPQWRKWTITLLSAFATLAVALVSSAFTGGVPTIISDFQISTEVVTLGISLFVLGFAVGPLLWAPMSELYGRQALFFGTYAMLTTFSAGAAGAPNIEALLIFRFFAGAFGSSPLTNSAGVIADMFPASERGLAITVFAAAPSLGPALGPIVGNFLGQAKGWRWVEGFMAIFAGSVWIICSLTVPETYTPLILRRRAAKMSKLTGKVYISKLEIGKEKKTVLGALKVALTRPWILLFMEPIVLLLSLFNAIVYGTLYMSFAAFPIVFEQQRHWSLGLGGLSFIGIGVGIFLGILYSGWDNKRYAKVSAKHNGHAPPEARLPPVMLASVFIPVGLFWFAWTNSPSIHWSVSIIGTIPFGFGMTLVFIGLVNYLVDAYVIYAASVLAANTVFRCMFGAGFPLFTTYMYQNLGVHWAGSIPAFLSLACVPFPFLFYKYGAAIRLKCKYSAEAAAILESLKQEDIDDESLEEEKSDAKEIDGETGKKGAVGTDNGVLA